MCITILEATWIQMADDPFFEAESKLTGRYQTTVPEPVRKALKLGKGARLHYRIRGEEVVLRRADDHDDGDPALGPFLRLLASELQAHPERLQPVDPALVERARELIKGVEVDRDAPLSPEDE
jgi:antitoxin PrlF